MHAMIRERIDLLRAALAGIGLTPTGLFACGIDGGPMEVVALLPTWDDVSRGEELGGCFSGLAAGDGADGPALVWPLS